MWFDQTSYDLRCDWGESGVAALAPSVDAIVIVDVLSFSTCVDVAVTGGATVYPHRWKDESATELARSIGGVLAGPRSRFEPSLSPVSLTRLAPGCRLVLPSPNGAVLSGMTGRTPTFAGCFRNSTAVAVAAQRCGPTIAVIAAGERWPDGTLRPSIEDWVGAGAILSHLAGTRSPEAMLAVDAFTRCRDSLAGIVRDSASGRELIEKGFPEDIDAAVALDVSATAPMLRDGAYSGIASSQELDPGRG